MDGTQYSEQRVTKSLGRFWGHVLKQAPPFSGILGVGNVDDDLRAIANFTAAPLELAGDVRNIDRPDSSIGLVFTNATLGRVPPDELLAACREIYRVSRAYIICVEDFSACDYGAFWLDNFDIKCLAYEFLWDRMTGMDNKTFWLFEKPEAGNEAAQGN